MSDYRISRPDNFPPVVQNLIIINVLVFLGQLFLTKYGFTEKLMLWPAMPARLHEILVQQDLLDPSDKFKPYQIITHLFAHSPTMYFHIIFNMLVLWMFGRVLESVWGSKRFLLFYILSGIGAAALHLLIQYYRCTELLHAIDANDMGAVKKLIGGVAPALGASGAIMGVMVGFAYLFPNTELYIMFIPLPVKAKWVVLAYVLIDLFAGAFNAEGDNIAHFAHLGGAITGFLIVFIWNKTNRKTLY